MSKLGQKYNKQGYGLDKKGTWKRSRLLVSDAFLDFISCLV